MLIRLKPRYHINDEFSDVKKTVNNINSGMNILLGSIRSFGPTSQHTVYVEDVLGWVIPIPLDIIRSWEESQLSSRVKYFN